MEDLRLENALFHKNTNLQVCVFVCVCACACECSSVYICVCVCMYIYIYIPKFSIFGLHRSLAKQDMSITNINLKILPVRKVPLSCISLKNSQ